MSTSGSKDDTVEVLAVEMVLLVVSLDRLQEHIARLEWIWREKLLGEEEGVETMQVENFKEIVTVLLHDSKAVCGRIERKTDRRLCI